MASADSTCFEDGTVLHLQSGTALCMARHQASDYNLVPAYRQTCNWQYNITFSNTGTISARIVA
jgi:hypothetical protein